MKRLFRHLSTLAREIRADYTTISDYKQKYSDGGASSDGLLTMFVKNIGFQSLAAIRVMQFAKTLPVPFGGEIVSRLIRHIYGMEVHWNASVAPGVSIVHGNGIVVSNAAKVGAGCILFQNVTLGFSRDPETGETGAPVLAENVHIGPGASLLGPITVGKGTKIMAGAVLMHSVPPYSLVRPAKATVTKRARARS